MPEKPPFPWPNGARAAASLTFDDGAPSQLDNAIPLLNDRGFRGTFYVTAHEAGPLDRSRDGWRDAVRAGHEIGNHSMSHPCSRNIGVGRMNLDDMTLDDMRREILAAKRRIEEAFPEQRAHSFAYPCGETHVGRGAAHTSYVPIVAEHYAVARYLGDGVVSNDPYEVDLTYTWSLMPVALSGRRMIEMMEEAAQRGRWTVYCFHGVGGDHLSVGLDAFRELVDHLVANRRRIWTDTAINVGTWIREHR